MRESLLLGAIAAAIGAPDAYSPRHVFGTRYDLPRKGVKRQRCAATKARRDANRRARAARRVNR